MEKDTCVICGSEDTAPHFGSDDRIYRCQRCGMAALTGSLRVKDMEDYYGSHEVYAESLGDDSRVSVMNSVANEYLDILVRYIDPVGTRLIDIGANYGALVQAASSRGFVASGMEKNRLLVEDGKRRGLDLFDEDLKTRASVVKPKAITMMHVLEHVPDPRRFVRDVHEALDERGIFLIEVPNIESYLAKKHALSWKYVAREHLSYFSPRTLSALLRQEGFEILETRSRNHFIKDLGLRQLLSYLFGTVIQRERFGPKRLKTTNEVTERPSRGPIFRLLKSLVVSVIHALHREDFLLIVARKSALPSAS